MTYVDYSSVAEMRARYRSAKLAMWGKAPPPRFAGPSAAAIKKPKPPVQDKTKLAPRLAVPETGKRSLENILTTVGFVTGRYAAEITGTGRSKFIMPSRLLFYYLAREFTTFSLPVIGKFCGGRDHATVSSGIDTAKSRLERKEVKFCEFEAKCRAILEGK